MSEAFLHSGDRIQGGQTVLEVEVQAEQPATINSFETPTLTRPAVVMVECANCGRREQTEASDPNEKMSFVCEDCREELKRQPQPVPGYEMIKLLGRGGMGCVMLASDEKTGRQVAIKTLLPEVAVTEVSLRRFMREIQVAAARWSIRISSALSRAEPTTAQSIWSLNTSKAQTRRGWLMPRAAAYRIGKRSILSLRRWTLWRMHTERGTSIATSRNQIFSSVAQRRTSPLNSQISAWQKASLNQA